MSEGGEGMAVVGTAAGADAASRRVRLPLQVGTTSLWSLGRAGAAFVPAMALVALSFPIDRAFDGWGGPPIWPQDVCLGGGCLLGLYALAHAYYAWRERPSDVVLDRDGIRVDGGRHDGAWARWEALHREACHIHQTTEDRITLGGIVLSALSMFRRHPMRPVPIARLVLVAQGSHPQIVARAESPAEMHSLQALLDSIRSGPWGRVDEEVERRAHEAKHRQAAMGIRVVECPECGAPTVASKGSRRRRRLGPGPRSPRRAESTAKRLETRAPARPENVA